MLRDLRAASDRIGQKDRCPVGLHGEDLLSAHPRAIENFVAPDRGRRDEAFGHGHDVVTVMSPQSGPPLGIDGVSHPCPPVEAIDIVLQCFDLEMGPAVRRLAADAGELLRNDGRLEAPLGGQRDVLPVATPAPIRVGARWRHAVGGCHDDVDSASTKEAAV